jgi:hypothetical protein
MPVTDEQPRCHCTECGSASIFKYELKREHDSRTIYGNKIKWLEFNEEGRCIQHHDKPAIGFACCVDLEVILGLHAGYQWLTTCIVALQIDEYDVITFETANSTYTLTDYDR